MKHYWSLLFLVCTLLSCQNDDDNHNNVLTCTDAGDCDKCVVIDGTLYDEIATDNYFIANVIINGDCLEIELTSSGCDGSTWVVDLVDSGALLESAPPQRLLKLNLKNLELCDAVITQSHSFNASELQESNFDTVILNIQDWGESIDYNY
ncbi:hypothetical protein [Mangrovimonas aestuarii]|uniref:hypothetical protein n=1 Tax=Mangrovimonas aestuarii TaxID=3018443 RepID=UPI00237A07D8|nr:hypothetical protein [Mangrovimonas aestuarii]